MLNKLSRILLALVTAVVFIGQMEAAAQHCARLAAAAEASPATDDAPPCHEKAQAATTNHHGGMVHNDDTTHDKAPDSCECIAALTTCADFAGSSASALVAPYAWLAAGEAGFASAKPDPDLRPPRV